MHHPWAPMPLLIAFTLVFGTTAAQINAQVNPSAPTGAKPEQQQGVEKAIRSESGKAGTQEPSSGVPTNDDGAVLVNGALNVAGAPKDSQTVPAKFSARNDARDKFPIMALTVNLTDEQRQKIIASVQQANVPVVPLTAKVTEELPRTVEMYDLSPAIKSEMPGTNGLKYVRLANKILLVYAPNWIVVGEIETRAAK